MKTSTKNRSFICCECVIRSIFEGYLGKLSLARKRIFFRCASISRIGSGEWLSDSFGFKSFQKKFKSLVHVSVSQLANQPSQPSQPFKTCLNFLKTFFKTSFFLNHLKTFLKTFLKLLTVTGITFLAWSHVLKLSTMSALCPPLPLCPLSPLSSPSPVAHPPASGACY